MVPNLFGTSVMEDNFPMDGVGVLCIGATGGRVGGTGVRVWRAPVGAGGGAGEVREAERHRQAKVD